MRLIYKNSSHCTGAWSQTLGKRKARGANSMTKAVSKTHTHYGIHFYALLLLSNIKWEVAYSTLCTEKNLEKKLYIIYTWQAHSFSKLNLWRNSHMLHTQTTQAHIDRVGKQWTIAAAKKKSPAATGPSDSKISILAK